MTERRSHRPERRATERSAPFSSPACLRDKQARSPSRRSSLRSLTISTSRRRLAGQLRTVSGLAAGLTALALARRSARVTLSRQLLIGSILLALGSLASAAAPPSARSPRRSCPSAPESRSSRPRARLPRPSGCRRAAGGDALVGADRPAGRLDRRHAAARAAGGHNWRYAWLVLPLATALLAGAAVAAS